MREIKFRCWQVYDYDENDNPKWQMINADDLAFESNEPLKDLLENSDNEIFMQFTGLKDKNGKEIFEGDIVEYKSRGNTFDNELKTVFAKIEYSDKFALFKARNIGDYGLRICDLGITEIEVIGNIYQNKDLLQ